MSERARNGSVDRAVGAPERAVAIAVDGDDSSVDEHVHYSHRAPWLRAFVLGANDGLVSVAALMLGVGGGSAELATMRLAGARDTEEADVEKERQQQLKGPAARARELEELTEIYVKRGLSRGLAREVATELTEKDVIRAHARDELGIDLDAMANPLQAAVVSSIAFTAGAMIPLLAGSFATHRVTRLVLVSVLSVAGLAIFGLTGSLLGGAKPLVGALRVVIGGCLAMGVTFGIGRVLGGGAAMAHIMQQNIAREGMRERSGVRLEAMMAAPRGPLALEE
ncbi:hypothetical protein VOLCADRAFT_107619 [Volvox carteri f. nagariensis]|uniref:Uncharacterized protein n=1 Tax=Volvox carteri f. nagariensis TaxID=3068 RepID=D8UF74_VOLCA|nr:uncharacterized protein VOLCADRAFT_107619 [Volvox carteri f. nagariensis]EFJ41666.1 hypothetical protein VOLCADRAFT_107619 [Volvox carteri f. nagariensis]|eukprot:XP_002957322.1 hypothetical protein VOLCADRAFT_107619 [Volvox carteri f. nagariensis]